MIHNLKIKRYYADKIIYGFKSWELRKNDRGFKVGDYIEFSVCDSPIYHDIDNKTYEIIDIFDDFGLKDGYVILSIEEIH